MPVLLESPHAALPLSRRACLALLDMTDRWRGWEDAAGGESINDIVLAACAFEASALTALAEIRRHLPEEGVGSSVDGWAALTRNELGLVRWAVAVRAALAYVPECYRLEWQGAMDEALAVLAMVMVRAMPPDPKRRYPSAGAVRQATGGMGTPASADVVESRP